VKEALLFCKKEPKLLTLWAGRPRPRRSQTTKGFLFLFFQKRRPCCRLPLLPAGYLGSSKKLLILSASAFADKARSHA
jgi:hypothetical protein